MIAWVCQLWMAEAFPPVSVNLNNTASWKRSKVSSFMYVSAYILISSFRESIYTALLASILFSWLAYNFIYIYLCLKYFLFFAERLETANRQLASRDFDGHEDKATEGLYATQSEYCAYLFGRCRDIYIYMHMYMHTYIHGRVEINTLLLIVVLLVACFYSANSSHTLV